jgi:hypothetical protein
MPLGIFLQNSGKKENDNLRGEIEMAITALSAPKLQKNAEKKKRTAVPRLLGVIYCTQ